MKREFKVFEFSIIINFFISILKIGGGLYFNFASLISDGMQTLSDFITDIVSFIGIKVSKKRPTKSHPFGFGKMEYIINLVIGVILLLLSIFIVVNGFISKWHIPSLLVLLILFIALILKIITLFFLYSVGKKINSQLLITSYQESKMDLYSSIGVIVATILLQLSDDIVIFSSSAIPGNALSIHKTINKLYLKGVKVFTNMTVNNLHTSGHANQEELKLMIRLLKPKYLMPFHGDYRMLKEHANLGIDCGIPKENTFILKNGDSLILKNHTIIEGESYPNNDIYVDGSRIGEVGSAVIRDRKIMASDGILVVIANINSKDRTLLTKPNITTRGFVLVNENEELIRKIEREATNVITEKLKDKKATFTDIKNQLSLDLIPFIMNLTGRRPLILPIILDIKK